MRLTACLLVCLCACKSGPTEADALAWRARQLEHRAPEPAAEPAPTDAPVASLFKHAGPSVAPGGTGPARYALLVWEAFEEQRALQLTEYVDRFWREPGNFGYEAVLARLKEELAVMCFVEDPTSKILLFETHF